ncbi:hypothetical protein [Hephaestia caeni]|uniref:hypothetical protein n=1 Tax=Hephaestia caeni TaxID=645617 RepID=UPI000E5C4F56
MPGYSQTGPYTTRTGFGSIGEALGGWRAIVVDPIAPSNICPCLDSESLIGANGDAVFAWLCDVTGACSPVRDARCAR